MILQPIYAMRQSDSNQE